MDRISASILILILAMLPALAAAEAGDDQAGMASSGSHSGWVTFVAFSPDGTQILSGSFDATAKIWDAATGKLIRTFDAFRKKRNASSYEVAGVVSDREVQEMQDLAIRLRAEVDAWIRAKHSALL